MPLGWRCAESLQCGVPGRLLSPSLLVKTVRHCVCCRQHYLVQLCWQRRALHRTLRNRLTTLKLLFPTHVAPGACCFECQAGKGHGEDAPLWLPRWRCTGEGMSAYPGALPLLGVLPPTLPPPPVAAAAAPVVAAAVTAALQGDKLLSDGSYGEGMEYCTALW